ncbi:MAG: DegT/DnrJ/EryC1/StrS family aminotransferase [Bdellovibrionales bacterium]|nr:DegT/DnrJ/EryC1/StrS family aminotransferase [Bdellovibrionales bacterium]
MAENKKFKIPFLDLAAQYAVLKPRVLPLIERVIEESAFVKGKYVAEFESRFVKMHEASGGVGCSNGTAAIEVALRALGVGEGDEVITTPNTFIATAEAILEVGARPVFADVDPETFLLDPAAVRRAIGPKTKAIMPVHLYGIPCDMTKLMEIANEHGLLVVEDCAQAHFAKHGGKYVGTFGDAATFSFYPGKNLGAYGDAGFLFVRDPAKLAVARKLVDHGRESKYVHDLVGANHRMDGLQGAVLGLKLDHILEWTKRRRAAAAEYSPRVKALGLPTALARAENEAVYHLFTVLVDDRDRVVERMQAEGIEVLIHYPVPLHLQPALRFLGYGEGSFPVAERVAKAILSLPVYPEITPDQIRTVVDSLAKSIGR